MKTISLNLNQMEMLNGGQSSETEFQFLPILFSYSMVTAGMQGMASAMSGE